MFKFTSRNTKTVSSKNLDGHPPQLKKNSIYCADSIENIKYFTFYCSHWMIMDIKSSVIYGDAPTDF